MKSTNRSPKDYLFLLPAFVIYASVIVIPTVYSIVLSFFKWNGVGEKTFVGFQNYAQLFKGDEVFFIALKNNLIWLVLTIVFITTVSLLFALVLNNPFRGRTVFRGIFYFPAVLAGIVVAIVWRWIYNPNYGFLNEVLRMLGLDSMAKGWLSDPDKALFYVFVAALWMGVGQPMILFLSGLQTVPADVLEAAEIDGASKLRRFFMVTVPLLKDTFIVVLATLIMAAMKVYDVIYGLTGGGPNNSTQTLATYMYSQTFMYNNVGMGTAVACLMLLMMLIIIVPYVMFTAKED